MSEALHTTAESARDTLADPAERGRLDIDRAVLRKLAEHAADQVPGCARTRRRSGLGERGTTARVHGPDQELRLRLDLALRYPGSVRDTVRMVRDRVTAELSGLAGCRVRTIDVTVSALVPAGKPPRVE